MRYPGERAGPADGRGEEDREVWLTPDRASRGQPLGDSNAQPVSLEPGGEPEKARTADRAGGSSRALWIGSLYYLLFFLAAGAYFPFLYVYFADLGLDGKQIGLLATLSPLISLLVSTPLAVLADRTGRRAQLAQLGFGCAAVTVLLLRLPGSFQLLIPLMVCLALFTTPVASLGEGLVARMAQRGRLNFGAMRLWGSLGYALSALGFGALWAATGLKLMFLVSALLHVPLLAVVGRLEETPANAVRRRRSSWRLLADRGLFALLAVTFLAGISNSLAMTFSGVYARWLGGGNALVGGMVAVSAVAELPSMYFSARIARRLGGARAVALSCSVMAFAFVGFSLLRTPTLLPALAVVKGLGYGVWITVTIRMVTQRTAEEWASTAQSLLTPCLFGAAPLVAGPLGGLLHDSVSPAGVFWLAAGSCGAAGLLVVLAAGRISAPERPDSVQPGGQVME